MILAASVLLLSVTLASLPPMQAKERPCVQRHLHPLLKRFHGAQVETVINGRRVVCRVNTG